MKKETRATPSDVYAPVAYVPTPTNAPSHRPLTSGEVIGGRYIQLSTDAGNGLSVGSDNGLFGSGGTGGVTLDTSRRFLSATNNPFSGELFNQLSLVDGKLFSAVVPEYLAMYQANSGSTVVIPEDVIRIPESQKNIAFAIYVNVMWLTSNTAQNVYFNSVVSHFDWNHEEVGPMEQVSVALAHKVNPNGGSTKPLRGFYNVHGNWNYIATMMGTKLHAQEDGATEGYLTTQATITCIAYDAANFGDTTNYASDVTGAFVYVRAVPTNDYQG